MLITYTRPLPRWYRSGLPPASLPFLFQADWVMSNTVPATARLPVRQVFTRPVAAFKLHVLD